MTVAAIISDLHIPFWRNCDLQRLADQCNDADIIFNLGDHQCEFADLIDKPYFECYGNHDYYNDKIGLDWNWDKDRLILTSTLWTNFGEDPMCEIAARSFVNDFRLVDGISINEIKNYYYSTIGQINFYKPEIVATHFGPFLQSIHPNYGNDALNRYFVNDMQGVLDGNPQIKLWIHGHTHSEFDYMNGDCHVICHPCGYPNENYSRFEDYSPKFVEI